MRILGIDFGTVRIGVAAGDDADGIAMPLKTIEITGVRNAVDQLETLCAEQSAGMLVVGLPVNMNGTRGPMAEKALEFAAKLRERIGKPVEMLDERLSSCMVEKALLEGDVSRSRRKGLRDKLAAQVILQGYFDSKHNENT